MYKFLTLLFLMTLFACDKRDLPTNVEGDSTFTIEKRILPSFINPGKSYPISAKINSESPLDVDYITLNIFKQGSSTPTMTLLLYDDGGAEHVDDQDIVAFDGIFANVLNWEPTGNSRESYDFSFEVQANNQNITLVEPVISLDNVPPQILSVDLSETLASGFETELIKAEISDSNGIDDIAKVLFKGIQNERTVFEGELFKDSASPPNNENAVVFAKIIDSTFAAGKKGDYQIIFEAVDKSNFTSPPINKNMTIENNPPTIGNVSGPAEFERPNSGTDRFLLSVDINDEQSLLDVWNVQLEWKKADGSYSSNSPFRMYDNGLPFNEDFSGWDDGYRGDVTANDGTFSIVGIFDPGQPLGNYTLTMYAFDLVQNKSAEIVHIIKLKDDE